MQPSKYILVFSILIVGLITSCKREPEKPITQPCQLKGGKGGDFYFAVFSRYNNKGIKARIYLKYAAEVAPADTNLYDEKYNTMTEPGFSHHVHFSTLTAGTYYVLAKSTSYSKDSIITITDSTDKHQDIYLNLR
ncbi:MAG: hypothetical protein NTX03_11510 [Bacteroidetes bacterium]|nr:hypothetical protein [Bacteroidota bacterium]